MVAAVSLRCATASVLTLHPHTIDKSSANVSGVCLRSKITLLEQQFRDHLYDVVGVQEGRSKRTEQTEGQHYTMLAAAAEPDGSLGVQCWVRHGSSVQFWAAVSPRILYVIVQRAALLTGFVVAHAPHSMTQEGLRLQWWAELTAEMHRLIQRYTMPWVLLIDANGRVGSVASTACGPSTPEPENPNGASLRLLSETFHMKIGNTWGASGPTWTSTHGTKHRIDYVVMTADVFAGMRWCRVDADIDLTLNAKEDHLVVALHARVLPQQPPVVADRPAVPRQQAQHVLSCTLRRFPTTSMALPSRPLHRPHQRPPCHPH